MKFLLLLPFKILALLFGNLQWSPPRWIDTLNQLRKGKPVIFWGICAVLIMAGIAYQYYQALPKPITVKAVIQSPAVTQNDEGALPDKIYVQFDYDFSTLNAEQQRPDGVPSVARIDLVGEEIKTGISLSPAKRGKWRWVGDRNLQFEPESDWSAGTRYRVTFDNSIINKNIELSTNTYEFTTPEFNITVNNMAFYQDPQNISIRRVVATLDFTHPVDQVSLQENLSMSMRPAGATINKDPIEYKFAITYDKNLKQAYIQSEPIALPEESNYMSMIIGDGVKSILGGKVAKRIADAKNKVLIPDIYSFLKVSKATAQIVRNKQNIPEQVVTLEFTDNISESELLGKLSLYLLPEYSKKTGRKYWRAAREVSDRVLEKSKNIDLKLIPNQSDNSKLYNFIVDLPENRYVYLKIEPGLKSVNNFVHTSFYDRLINTPKYPKDIKISGEGSVLTSSGEHKLNVLSRGIPALKYRIGRILDGQLYHLISQTYGDIKSPVFENWKFDANNISAFSEQRVDLNIQHPAKAVYSSLDLSHYLPQEKNSFGLFFVEVIGLNKRHKEIYGVRDTRLILVTDLGVIVKK